MKFEYAAIPKAEAKKLNLPAIRREDKKGFVIINQDDMRLIEGDESNEVKIKRLGGKILTKEQAKKRLKQ